MSTLATSPVNPSGLISHFNLQISIISLINHQRISFLCPRKGFDGFNHRTCNDQNDTILNSNFIQFLEKQWIILFVLLILAVFANMRRSRFMIMLMLDLDDLVMIGNQRHGALLSQVHITSPPSFSRSFGKVVDQVIMISLIHQNCFAFGGFGVPLDLF